MTAPAQSDCRNRLLTLSVVAISPEGQEVEAGLFGFDGVGPVPAIMGSELSPIQMQSQIPGHGHRLPRTVLSVAMDQSASLRGLMLKFPRP